MSKKDYYEVLGVDKTAKPNEIKKAYRSLVKKNHPDAGGDEELFKEIAEAYSILSDADKKRNYDQFGHDSGNQNPFSRGFGRGFTGGFDFGGSRPERVGENMTLLLKLTLEEIYTGNKKKFKYNRQDKCNSCGGHGGTDIHDCPSCNGSGMITRVMQTPIGYIQQSFTCNVCGGLGKATKNICTECNGNGTKQIEEVIEIDIPAGVQEGMTFIMGGKGHAVKSGKCGDLLINVTELAHETYTRNGNDLKMVLKLNYPQLVLGDKVDIKTIEGSLIRVNIPEHSDVGSNLRVQHKGLKFYGKEQRGDIIITLDIDIPKNISEELREVIIHLKEKL